MKKILIKFVIYVTMVGFSNLTHSADNTIKQDTNTVVLTHGIDASAGGLPSYIITTSYATYYLEKDGGGLSSIVDRNGVDWLGFHPRKGSGHKGEYRGFPNAVHKQDGNYFHPMNSATDNSTSEVIIDSDQHVRIMFTSENKQWQGQWDFLPERLDFTMNKISEGYHYWIQYEGVPNGKMDSNDFWFASADNKAHPIEEPFIGDLPEPEWIAFGDKKSSRMLYLLHHQGDSHPDNYVSRPDMTVFAFGREQKSKFLNRSDTFSIGFVESKKYTHIKAMIESIIKN